MFLAAEHAQCGLLSDLASYLVERDFPLWEVDGIKQ